MGFFMLLKSKLSSIPADFSGPISASPFAAPNGHHPMLHLVLNQRISKERPPKLMPNSGPNAKTCIQRIV